ncbi:MAG: GNAT family N-acetyltransferase [Acidimicrobiia bacterium]|nr:GNAT family N-acetyltransferase [Acidimicrobiia bacterium]NNF09186.1 GNAT family N-acetyltransferase [Acidimicrobiia bacterium]NNL71109.1 GNAT family N-acetyltransferase [Acidimicrobiia bacterium]
MVDYPADLEFDVVLKDGGTARLRPIRAEDRDELDELFNRLSAEAVYQRFFRAKNKLTPEELEYFTNVDYDDRMAFVVLSEATIIGVGRYDRTKGEDDSVAEVAFAVDDAHHGRGIGTQLLQHLTYYARTRGITGFSAWVLPDNYPMMRVFRNSGFTLRRHVSEGVYLVEFPTEETPESLVAEGEHEKRAIATSLLPIFYPRSVAVIGASRNPASIGGRLFHNLLSESFAGAIFPVNPSAPAVNGVRAYSSVLEIPDPVDLAFIVVPKQYVIAAVRECAEKGVRGLVVITAGFSEAGEEGESLEDELLEIVRNADMRMVGPNCMGVLNTDASVQLNGTFAPLYPPAGNVAMSSQSGALGIAILDYAKDLNIGISTFVSVGNKSDVSGNDLLLYWEDDPATDVILLYLESFGNPRRFSRLARRIGRKKPIVAVKSGRTSAGTRAASSHTGALASADTAVEALFRQSGVIRTHDLDELFDITALLANQPVPKGRRVAVLTNAGGPGILLADALESIGLTLPEFSGDLQKRLQVHLSDEATVRNPVDMVASAGPDEYRVCLAELMDTDEVDAVIVIHIPAAPTGTPETAAAIRDASVANAGKKTLLSVFMRSEGPPPELHSDEFRVPSYRFPESAARALARAAAYGEWLERPTGSIPVIGGVNPGAARATITQFLEEVGDEGGWLEPDQVAEVLSAFGLELPRSATAPTADAAAAIAAEFGGPVVLKVISDSALHKSDIGGVALNLDGEQAVREGFDRVTSVVDDATGVLVQEFIAGGHEVIVGMTEDASFGPLILFGLGGIFVELMRDAAFRIHPITDLDAAEMIKEVKASKLLDGYRGEPPGDVPALQDAILRVSALIGAVPEIVEMDLNPVKVLPPGQGIRAVDARIKVRRISSAYVPGRVDIPATESTRA